MSEGGRTFERSLNAEPALRTAQVRQESGNYVYDFDPALSISELKQNPDYESLVKYSLAYGGFRAKQAVTQDGEGHGYLELAVSSSAPQEHVAELFDRLRSARIADIKIGSAAFHSNIDTLKPQNEAERAILSLLARQVSGARIDARIEQEANGTFKRVGYALMDGDKEVAFATVPTEYTDLVSMLTSLTATRDSYLGEITRGFR